jgi:diguanylate cyclase (GGDEF)-like protein
LSAAPHPDDEPLRLATLHSYGILDTPPDRPFDCLVELARQHFKVPISLIAMVDADRQWFKSVSGLDRQETPRDHAFCAYTILNPHEVMVVEDAAADDRFAENPLVTGDPSIRFYAGAPIRAPNGQPVGTICVIDRQARRMDDADRKFLLNLADSAASMLELHRRNLALQVTSGRDPLTGVANRRVFDTALAEACRSAASGVPCGLLILDLDYFKTINDTQGHGAGDAVLQQVAKRITSCVRDRDLVARIGGDEFAVIAAGPIDQAGLRRMAARILDTFDPPIVHNGVVLPARTSIGLALAPQHGTNPDALTQAADRALYNGKRNGRNSITLAGGPDAGPVLSLQDELRAAIAEAAPAIHWQPYFAAGTLRATGHEALLRWTRANGQSVPPFEVVAMAENGGFIMDLDRMVLLKACRQAAAWPRPLSASVNMSAWSFSHLDLVDLVRSVLGTTGLDPRRLVIELTESTLVKHTAIARERIAGLHALGVRVAIDDFGTGFASLGYLSSFDFDVLKLDRTFVQGLDTSTRSRAVANAVLALGKALDMTVCAEGVETAEQLRFLQDGGCDTIQGYLLGRPQPRIFWPEAADLASVAAE